MESGYRLLGLLADGRFHSTASLGRELGLDPSAVGKQVRALRDLGVDLVAGRGRGYRLRTAVELLDEGRIGGSLSPAARALLGRLELRTSIDSTNRHLMRQRHLAGDGAWVCLAECQTAGQGRRGRCWVSPFAANLYLSALWSYAAPPAMLQGLSLAVGVVVCRALGRLGVTGVGLKWPNDFVLDTRKLGGALVEVAGGAGGPFQIVAGIGLNVGMPADSVSDIDQPWTDLSGAPGGPPSRNRLAAAVIDELLPALDAFGRHGFEPFHREWDGYDTTRGRRVRIDGVDGVRLGTAMGVDERGALLVEVAGAVHAVLSGDVSLRVAA